MSFILILHLLETFLENKKHSFFLHETARWPCASLAGGPRFDLRECHTKDISNSVPNASSLSAY